MNACVCAFFVCVLRADLLNSAAAASTDAAAFAILTLRFLAHCFDRSIVWLVVQFLVDSYKAILRTALGLLHLNEAQLLTWEMEEIVIYLKQLPDSGLFTARNIKAASLHPRFACVRNVELARLERKWRAEHQAASAASDESSRLNSSHSSRHGSISSSSTVPAPQHSAVVQPLAQPAAAGPRRGGSPLPIAHAATRPR